MEYKFADFELKASEGRSFSGYGSVFDIVDQGKDVVTKSAFSRAIKSFSEGGRKPKMLWQHDPNQPIGVWKKMEVDERGLKLEGELLEVGMGETAYALLKAGALDGLSIGYRTLDYEIEKTTGGESVRKLKDVELMEVSIVTFPMNVEATVTDVKQLQSPREVERILRKAGVPGTFAKLLSLHGYEEAIDRLTADHRDDDDEAKQQEALENLFRAVNGLKETLNA